MSEQADNEFSARAIVAGRVLSNAAIRDIELVRARQALGYLKAKIGNAGMRDLLQNDLEHTQARNRAWVTASNGRWKSGVVELIVPGPRAAEFHAFFLTMMKEDRQADLRAAHPEHFMNVPLGRHAEVIENVGQDELPWLIRLDFTSPDAAFPTAWDPAYPAEHRLGAIIKDADGLRIGSAIHEMRDAHDGMHVKLTIHLPEAAPDALIAGHLHHFSVEFRNWTLASISRLGSLGHEQQEPL